MSSWCAGIQGVGFQVVGFQKSQRGSRASWVSGFRLSGFRRRSVVIWFAGILPGTAICLFA